MRKHIGLFDMDGVLVDLCKSWLEKYNREYDDSLSLNEMFGTWNPENVIKPEAVPHIYNMFDKAEEYAALDPIKGAIEGMQKLHDSNKFNLYILTAFMGKGGVADGKCIWLNEHLPFIDPDRIILAHDKELVMGDFFVDDSEKNLLNWVATQREFVADTISIMMEAPHNRDFDITTPKYSDIDMKVADWTELTDYLLNVVA